MLKYYCYTHYILFWNTYLELYVSDIADIQVYLCGFLWYEASEAVLYDRRGCGGNTIEIPLEQQWNTLERLLRHLWIPLEHQWNPIGTHMK